MQLMTIFITSIEPSILRTKTKIHTLWFLRSRSPSVEQRLFNSKVRFNFYLPLSLVTVQCGYKYSRDRRLTKTFLFFKYRIEIDFYMDMHNSSENIIFMAMMDSQCILKTACKLNK